MELSEYKDIILELKSTILSSRFRAAKLVNKELIGLYFSIGRKIGETATREAWGSKVLEQISVTLQNELPGLRGFSSGNLKKMRVFSDFWEKHLKMSSALPNLFNGTDFEIGSTVSNQSGNPIPDNFSAIFFSVSFSHHYIIASKSKNSDEVFY